MKKTLILLLFCLSQSLFSAIYYVATTGNDAAAGTIGAPWLTWGHAFTSASAGDTVYFRGGVYPHSVTTGAGYTSVNDGTAGNLIYYLAYPGETPILDASNVTPVSGSGYGIVASISYAYFKGLTVRNVKQVDGGVTLYAYAWRIYDGTGVTFENCTAYNIHGTGFNIWGGDETYFINCDSYNNCDSLSGNDDPGNNGYGFSSTNTGDANGTIYYRNCRAWGNGDDGWAMYSVGYIEIDGCWSFLNGKLLGGGSGYKIGFSPGPSVCPLRRVIINSVAAYNRFSGFTTNDNGDSDAQSMHIYNNIAYRNYDFSNDYPYPARGFIIYNTADSDADELARIYRNNISYGNTVNTGDLNIRVNTGASYTHSNNTWDASVTVTDIDFLSVDSTGITAARQADGSLPDNDCYNEFLRLASTSDLIDAGTDVGLDYVGTAPDIGREYREPGEGEEVEPLVIFTTSAYPGTTTASVSGNVYDDGGGTISARGVCWGTDANPDLTDNVVSGGTGTGTYTVTITGLTVGETYHVRAYATNEAGTSYGTDLTFTTRISSLVRSGGKYVFVNNKWVKI